MVDDQVGLFTDHADFIREVVISETTEERDLARLVYADWLEERGDPLGEKLRLEGVWWERTDCVGWKPHFPNILIEFRKGVGRVVTWDFRLPISELAKQAPNADPVVWTWLSRT